MPRLVWLNLALMAVSRIAGIVISVEFGLKMIKNSEVDRMNASVVRHRVSYGGLSEWLIG